MDVTHIQWPVVPTCYLCVCLLMLHTALGFHRRLLPACVSWSLLADCCSHTQQQPRGRAECAGVTAVCLVHEVAVLLRVHAGWQHIPALCPHLGPAAWSTQGCGACSSCRLGLSITGACSGGPVAGGCCGHRMQTCSGGGTQAVLQDCCGVTLEPVRQPHVLCFLPYYISYPCLLACCGPLLGSLAGCHCTSLVYFVAALCAACGVCCGHMPNRPALVCHTTQG